MNTATQNLENDHVHILRLTDIMAAVTMVADPDVNHLETIVSLIRNFADGIHHEKEEQLLFPLLGERGFSEEQGPVAVMLHEHTQGRNFVKGMAAAIEEYKAGNREAIAAIYENMQGYVVLLRAHISKENNILFRMADRAFTDADQRDLLEKFSQVEENGRSGNNPAGFIGKIDFLASVYLP